MTIAIHIIMLALRTHQVWPEEPLDRVTVAAAAAVSAETDRVPAELLMAIAQHESDLAPRAVSWRRRGGQRVDRIVGSDEEIPARGPLACGLVSSIAPDRSSCAKLLDATSGMAAGVVELEEWLARSRGDVRRALAGYASGNKGFALGRSLFGDAFLRRARTLGAWPSVAHATVAS